MSARQYHRIITLRERGLALADAEAQHRRTPETFHLPTGVAHVGDLVKLCFQDLETFRGKANVPMAERVAIRTWVRVTRHFGTSYRGFVYATVFANDLNLVDVQFNFEKRHIYDVDKAMSGVGGTR